MRGVRAETGKQFQSGTATDLVGVVERLSTHGSQELQTSFRKSSRNLSTPARQGEGGQGFASQPSHLEKAVTPSLQNQPPNACSEVMGDPRAAGSWSVYLCVNTDPGSSDLQV